MQDFRNAVVALVATMLTTTAAPALAQAAWIAPIDTYATTGGELRELVTAPNGDSALLASVFGSRTDTRVTLYAAVTAAPLWQRNLPDDCLDPDMFDGPYGGPYALAVGPDGDLYAATATYSKTVCVVRLARADGHVVWRYRESPAGGTGTFNSGYDALAFDAAGNVYAAGPQVPVSGEPRPRLIKLDAASGARLWQYEQPGVDGRPFEVQVALAADAQGGMYLAARYGAGATLKPGIALSRIDGNGAPQWQQNLEVVPPATARCDSVFNIVLAPLADAALAGGTCTDTQSGTIFRPFLRRFAAADGAAAWTVHGTDEILSELHVGTAGEIVGVGRFDAGGGARVSLRRFNPASGAALWTSGPVDTANLSLRPTGAGKALAAFSRATTSIVAATVDLATGALGADIGIAAGQGAHWIGADAGGRAGVVTRTFAGNNFVDATITIATLDGRAGTTIASTTATDADLFSATLTTRLRDGTQPLLLPTTDGAMVTYALPQSAGMDQVGSIIVKRDARTGRERWRHAYSGSWQNTAEAAAIALLANGDVAYTEGAHVLTRLNGATGAVLWQVPAPSGFSGRSNGLAADIGGDLAVLVEGPPVGNNQARVYAIKYAGSDGQERWRSALSPSEYGAVDSGWARPAPNGDLFAGNTAAQLGAPDKHHYFVRLRANDGSVAWRVEIDQAAPGAFATDLSVAPNGDLLVIGDRLGDAWAMRLRGSDGLVLWSRSYAAIPRATRSLFNPDGTIVLGTRGTGTTSGWSILRVSGSDGTALWTRTLPYQPTRGGLGSLARAPDGTVLASGECLDYASLCIVGLAPADGADRWSYTRPAGATDPYPWAFAQDMAFDARGNLVVAAHVQGTRVPTRRTAALLRVVGPWADDLFVDGFE